MKIMLLLWLERNNDSIIINWNSCRHPITLHILLLFIMFNWQWWWWLMEKSKNGFFFLEQIVGITTHCISNSIFTAATEHSSSSSTSIESIEISHVFCCFVFLVFWKLKNKEEREKV